MSITGQLQRFRDGLERDMAPESWTALDAPVVLFLADMCDALELNKEEKAAVLGIKGTLALKKKSRPTFAPHLPMNERQRKAMTYAREHGVITARAYLQLCPYWSRETLRLDLAGMVERGLLIKNGRKKGTCYLLPQVARINQANQKKGVQ